MKKLDNMNEIVVSVIVPVYNVEAYLDKCIESIVNQTYTNLEIILIDDGSTDSCGEKCDNWKLKDTRIVVIHKKNGGLSSARNAGCEIAKGKYIQFVDSDDWIDTNMIDVMLREMESGHADVVCCGMNAVKDDEVIELPWYKKEVLLDTDAGMDLLIKNQMLTSHSVSKMYKAILFQMTRFPEEYIYEDIRIMHKVFAQCKLIKIIPYSFYNYLRRDDSISNKVSLKNRLDWIEALEERYNYVLELKAEYGQEVLAQMAMVFSLTMMQNKFSKEEINKEKMRIQKLSFLLKDNVVKTAVKQYMTTKQYIIYCFVRFFSWNSNKIYSLLVHKH